MSSPALPHSRQHRCPPSSNNVLAIVASVALVLMIGAACHAPTLVGCAR